MRLLLTPHIMSGWIMEDDLKMLNQNINIVFIMNTSHES